MVGVEVEVEVAVGVAVEVEGMVVNTTDTVGLAERT